MNESDGLSGGPFRSWLKRLEVDRAVSFALAARAWQMMASAVTALLIASYFSAELQGYYYTFWSLLGLQTFAELGFQLVLVHIASHEWAHLQLGPDREIHGDSVARARLSSLVRLALTWYLLAAMIFVPIVYYLGARFFGQKETAIVWLAPWLALVFLSGLSLSLSALVALLEGCNQVATVQKYRLFQAITGNLVVWSLIGLGAGLWVAVAALCVQLLWELYLVAVVYRPFWATLFHAVRDSEVHMSWRHDVWPLQWRVALQSILHFLAYQLFVPVMFHYQSPEVAGRMGMTWTVLNACQSMAFIWVQTRMPVLGMLVAKHEYAHLDRLFWRITLVSSGVLLAAAAAFSGGVVILGHLPGLLVQRLASRLLPFEPVVIFSLAIVLLHVPRCLGVYLRSHKKDPLLWMYVVANSVMAAVVFVLGSQYGATAAAAGFLSVVVVIILPGSVWIWSRCRREWHADHSP